MHLREPGLQRGRIRLFKEPGEERQFSFGDGDQALAVTAKSHSFFIVLDPRNRVFWPIMALTPGNRIGSKRLNTESNCMVFPLRPRYMLILNVTRCADVIEEH